MHRALGKDATNAGRRVQRRVNCDGDCHKLGAGGVFMARHPHEEEPMSRTTRIPRAEITGLYGYLLKRLSRKLLGDVPEPAEVVWHNRPVLNALIGFGRNVQKW